MRKNKEQQQIENKLVLISYNKISALCGKPLVHALIHKIRHKILEQCQSEDYRKKLRQKRPREDCSFHEKSMNSRKKLRSRLSKTSVFKDSADGDLEKRSNNSESKVSGSRNEQNNSSGKIGLGNICQQNKTSGNFKLKSNSSLETLKKDNLNIKKFKCKYCSYRTKYKRSYNVHCAKHKNVKLFECNICDFETNYKSCLIRHNLKHCSEVSELNSTKDCANQLKSTKYFSLSLSEVILLIYNKRKLSDENISIPSPAEPIKCLECNFEAENQICMDLHSQIHSEVHKCPECNYKSIDTETFKDHLIKIHLGHSTSESESVPYSLSKRIRQAKKTGTSDSEYVHYKLRKRSKQPNKTGTNESESVPYTLRKRLRQPSKTGTYESYDEEHSEISEDYNKPHRKKRCNYATRKNENFVAHCLDHSNKKVFKCDHCDFKTNYKRLLRNHELNCIKNQENILNNCFNIAIDENVDYHSLSLYEIINLICNQDKSLDHNTSDETITEVLKCLECTFETGNQKIFNLHSQIHVEGKKCTECKFESKDVDTFKGHLKSHLKCKNIKEQKIRDCKKPHLNTKKFKCNDCPYESKYKTSFDAHCAEHKNIKLFKCDHCDFESNYKSHLVSHNLNRCPNKTELNSNKNCVVNQLKNSKRFSLSLSEIMLIAFNKRNSLDENVSVSSPTELLKCSKCRFVTENSKYLEFHSQIHSEVQKCPECGYESTDIGAFIKHLVKAHLDQSTIESESAPSFRKRSKQFDKIVVGDSSDEEHIKISGKQKPEDSDFEGESVDVAEEDTLDYDKRHKKKLFKCPDCSYVSFNSTNFVFHCLNHNKKKLFRCEHCGFKTNFTHTIKKHNLKCIKNQENSPIECFNIAIDENVNYHLLSLSEIINFICNKDKSLDINTTGLVTKGILKCLECTFQTGNQKIFNLHSQIHVEVKKCTECNFESKDTETFKDHLIGHFKPKNIEKQKMFKCCDCSYETKYKISFDAHCAKHKNIKLFKCDDCDFKSDYKGNLVSHKLYCCPKKAKLNSNENCVVNQSKNSQYFSLSLSEILLLIYNKRNSLDENASVPSPTESLKCPQCSFETENQKYLKLHSQIHSDVQKCPECSYESTDTETFKCHLIKTHLNLSTSESEFVSYSFRKRSRQSNKIVVDDSSDEEHIKISEKQKRKDSDFEDELEDIDSDIEDELQVITEESTLDSDKRRRKKRFKCDACSYATCKNSDFLAHCLNHANEKLFKCEHCDFKTNYRHTIKKHNLKCLKNLENSFSECFSIAIDENVNYHILSLSEMINLICTKDMSLDHNTSDETITEVSRCLECTFETGNQKIFNLHSQIHVEVKKCTECNFESKETAIFKDHLIGHFTNKNIKEQKMFKCCDCSYETEYKTSFDAHCAKHKNIKLFKCDDCDFESNYKRALVSHKLYRCSKKAKLNSNENCVSECFSIAIHENVNYHLLSLSEVINLICNKGKSLDINTTGLVTKGILKCLECTFETRNQKIFNLHSQIHVEVKKCTECNFENANTETFKDHLIGHFKHKNIEKQKMFKCCDCSYETKYKTKYDAHCAEHKNIKLFKCDHCDFGSNNKRYLKSHKLNHCPKRAELNSNKISECFSIAIDENVNCNLLSLSEVINLICNKGKSLDINTTGLATKEVLRCLECPFETGNQKIFNLHSQIHVEVKKCTECNFESKETATFKDHLIGHFKHKNIEKQKMFKCNDCPYESKYKTSFDAHCAEHKNIKLFKCDHCDFESNYKSHLVSHNLNRCPNKNELNSNKNCVVNQSENSQSFSLSLSEIMFFIFNKRNSLDENVSVSSPTELLKCSKCSFVTENSKYLEFHSQIHSEIQKCPECGFESTDTETFIKHLIKTHLNQLKIGSGSVSYSLNKRSRRFNKIAVDDPSDEEHIEISSKQKPEDSDFEDGLVDVAEDTLDSEKRRRKKWFKCPDCSYVSCNSTNFVFHCLNHNKKKLFKCEHCDFKTNYRRTIRKHNLKCIKNQKNSLSECFNKAIDENVDYHSLSLSEIISFICNQDKSLDHNSCDETTTEVLKCLECTFETGNQKIFNLHSQIHVEVKKCTECNFESKETAIFKDHLIKTHLNESKNNRPITTRFKCPDCSYTSINYGTFVAHCLDHVNEKLFQCENCDFKTNYKPSMKNHVLKCLKNPDKSHSKCYSISNNKENINYHLLSLSEIMNLVCKKTNSLDLNTSDEATKEEVLKCLECTFKTGNLKHFNLHFQIHVEVKKCTECSFEINCLEKFKNHLITHLDCCGNKNDSSSHSCRNSKLSVSGIYEDVLRGNTDKEGVNRESKKFNCGSCTYATNSEELFTVHCSDHCNEKLSNDKHCDFETNSQQNKESHNLTVKKCKNMKWEVQECLNRIKTRNKTKSQRKDYACDKCTNSYADFLSHKLVHNNEKSDCVDITTHLDNLKDYSFSDIISMICNGENEVNQDINLDSETKLHKCSQCSFECSDEVKLLEHLSSHSTEEKLICSQCSFEGTNQSDLDSHLQTHSTFKCSKCSYECSDIAGLNLHSCEPNSDKIFTCSECDFETKKEKHLTLHSQLHAKLRKCTECSYSNYILFKFKEHLKSHLPTKLYTCTKCSYKTNFIKQLKVHLFNHTNIRVFTCPQCDYKTNYKSNMKFHLETHIKVKTYRCSECEYSTPKSASLKEHIFNHSQIKQFLCGECDYGCNNKNRMKEHLKQHSNERPLKCSECDFSTKYKKHLNLHKAKHTGQFSYSCSECDFKCVYKHLLKQHSLKHAKTKLYKCPECSYQCNYNLKLHMINMHSKTKMYKCSECKYESNHRSNFLSHVRTHSSDRNYSCSECSFTSKRKGNLKMHLMTHLQEKLFKCDLCDYKCTHKYQLKRHILIH
ncbi:Zinc finger protein [Armadillidium nasatum]|uniref:Zinc finger protein n=1 Tax=Armadillidium nasatum TaxID=96803 RepID=A0A5N5TC92_9CRUS|nr:Zinc finger protein [Armadillidium nasatum]